MVISRMFAKHWRTTPLFKHLTSATMTSGVTAKAVGAALVTNQALRSLNLSGNKIGTDGATAIAEALTANEPLMDLNVSGNEFGDAGALAVGAALQTNSALQS
eukprot:Selendium_serpulae@DN6596_c0_g1_i1.p3